MEKISGILEKRREKLNDLRKININPFPNQFEIEHTIRDIRQQIETSPDVLTESQEQFSLSGRMIAINHFGKSAFVRFRDRTGTLQAYIRKDQVDETAYQVFKLLDIGDFIRVKGAMFQTRTGEWTILAKELQLVCKSLRPLPEKFHGLRDPEKRYRQRYLDLIMNAETRELFIRRSAVIQEIRNYFIKRDFLEVETPMMQPIPGGAEATPFRTHHNALGMDLFLRIAPELYLKRLVVGGLERVFEINRNFRNEGVSTQHNPEFTMLEFYQAYATYQTLMDLTESLIRKVAETVTGSTVITYQGNPIDFGKNWRRMTLEEALCDIGGLNPDQLNDRRSLMEFAEAKGITLTKTRHLGKIITKLFDVLVEPELIHPTFITGYPVEVSPLSRRNEKIPEITDRFELFIGGFEIANGFSELNDPDDQKQRFLQQVGDRESGDSEAHLMDEDYIEALEYGMPPTAGEGIGIDRLVMLMTDAASIREVIFFPHMRKLTDRIDQDE